MRDTLLTQSEIANRAGLSQQAVSMILNGDREVSKGAAERLELATAVCRTAWLWPEHIFNPYIPFDDTVLEGRLWVIIGGGDLKKLNECRQEMVCDFGEDSTSSD